MTLTYEKPALSFWFSLPLLASFAAIGCSTEADSGAPGPDGGARGPDATPDVDQVAEDAAAPPPVARCEPDESGAIPDRPEPGTWQRIEIEGAMCSNGSSYPIFVNYSATSNNLVVMLEPGGACWDYGSCSPDGGLRGAANPNGIGEGVSHIATLQYLPLLRSEPEVNPASEYNKIFVPYCTGDIHTGNNTITYEGPNGEELEFHHNGHDNIQRVIKWIGENFEDIPKLLVTGCSAGGAGALINYHFFRQGLESAVQCGYLLDDSGPIFPSSGNSGPLHEKVRESWNVDPILDSLEGQFEGISVADIKADFSLMNLALADLYPKDRIALTLYRRDLNYSLYSYENFYDGLSYQDIHQLWEEDIALLRELYDTRQNLGYYIPFWRLDNCSHCVSIPPIGLEELDPAVAIGMPWLNSDIEEQNINLREYVVNLLDDTQPMSDYFESEQEGEGFTDEQAAICQEL